MSIERIQTGPRMSQAVIHNGTVYLAGQVGDGATVAEQTADILAQIDRLLAAAGSGKERLLSATIWLTDMATFPDMNRVWDSWVVAGSTPARATVETGRLASSEYQVEIAVIAARA